MLRALALAIRQLGDRAILAVLVKSVALTLLIFAALGTAVYFGFSALLERIGWNEASTGLVAAFGALLLVVFGGLVLFRAVALAVIGFFAEDVVEAVERRYYPARAASAVPPSAWRGLKIGLRSALRAILWNLIALPLYFALLITAVGAPMVFLIVNAFLIGKDLQEMVIARHDASPDSTPERIAPVPRFVLGLIAAVGLGIPFLNLVVPVIAAAMAAHMIHGPRSGRTVTA
ncbi:EI24 domain-containing protein [Novosphingopyxis iocasae]|uniref:EI24 domain-containing protein n=1 Tax=Novosphingopyxis iocasae TaxID=2762729 RepID=UPI0016516105|nr:EI24 domain-containing protein [Novosphingopyxis iocasae]